MVTPAVAETAGRIDTLCAAAWMTTITGAYVRLMNVGA
jgi:hypothetical protein